MTNQIKQLHQHMLPISDMVMGLTQDLPELYFTQAMNALQEAEKALRDGLRFLEHGNGHIINKKPFYKGVDGLDELLEMFYGQVITHKILFAAIYNSGYDGEYFVLSEKDGELYKCECATMLGDYPNWNPQKVTIDKLKRELLNNIIGSFHVFNYDAFKAELAQFLEIDLLS